MLYLFLDHTKKRSYTRQIYMKIRNKILTGELKADEPLPSSRDLSRELCVAKNTVLTAYDMLVSEGAVYSIAGSGFYVCSGVKKPPINIKITNQQIASLTDFTITDKIINFDSGLPALDLFPREKWNRAVSHAFLDAPISALGYDNPQGRPEFREILCDYLKKTREILCTPEQIIVTSGTKQSLSLVAKCLLNCTSEIWIEDPSNANVRKIFSYYTSNIVPLEVDEQGIQPDLFPTTGTPTLIFTTPFHQFPMGGILPISRRIQLVEFARKVGAYLLEDDYDNDFNYDVPPPHSLFELDNERVIYTGTFSKILFPSIRLGYIVVPSHLVSPIRELKRLADHHSNSIYQLALMRFIESGELIRHIKRMRKIYRQRRDFLLEYLPSYFKGKIQIYGSSAGMHVVVRFEDISITEEHIRRTIKAGIYIVPVSQHSLMPENHTSEIIMGYAGLSQEVFLQGLEQLKLVLYPVNI